MKVILFFCAMLFPYMLPAQDIHGFVSRQMATYPESRLLDIYKSCFQDYMGAEHLVSDRQRVKAYLDEELHTTTLDNLMPLFVSPIQRSVLLLSLGATNGIRLLARLTRWNLASLTTSKTVRLLTASSLLGNMPSAIPPNTVRYIARTIGLLKRASLNER